MDKEQSPPAITPSYDRTPEHPVSTEPAATAEPAPAAPIPAKQQRKPKPVPRHKRNLQHNRKPRRYNEWDSQEFRHDQQLLDLQLRIRSLREFLKQRDLWTPFTAANPWW